MERNPALFTSILFLLHCLILAASAHTNITTDQDALLALKAQITHDPTNFLVKNWNTNTSVCSWIGVTCDNMQNRVIALNISDMNLAGSIPFQLGNLSSLQTLDLSSNRLSGTISSSIFSISTMKFLNLSVNQLSGSFPSLDNISALLTLDFRHNILSGELPANICNYFPYLGYLYLRENMFYGEIPTTLSRCKQLQYLSLAYNNFSGAIPKEIGNLTMLRDLDLSFNALHDKIPQELGYLVELEFLTLENNLLTGTIPSSIFNLSSISTGMDFSENNLTGRFPDNMCHRLSFVQGFDISGNQFTGQIPSILSNCKKLQFLDLTSNHFSGAMPKEIGNLTDLKELYLGENKLQGEIPHEIGNLRNLEILVLEINNLIGVVPATIFNMSAMKILSLHNNSLTGSLPSSADLELPNLKRLYLSDNNFSGPIPSFIFNAFKLSHLQMQYNSFSGFITTAFGNLRNLESLNLAFNYLTSSTPEFSFLISSLTNCPNLKILWLSGNQLHAILPISIGNLSDSLEQIYMFNCCISGRIPKEIGYLTNLTALALGANELNGSVPLSLGRLHKLQGLDLQTNRLEGSIPDDLCHLATLFLLNLHGNKLSGSIPACLGNLTSLRYLVLDSNELTSIPSTFWNLKDVLLLNFSSNSLTGPLPLEVGNLKVVVEMDLSKNHFSGDIPTTITALKDLQILFLGYNRLTGSIPASVGDLTSLESLDLSNNNLSGFIPKSMEKIRYLKHLNLSFNRLEGEIPREGSFANLSAESFIGNDLLCGSPNLKVPPCESSKTNINRKSSRKNVLLLGIVLPLSTLFIIVIRFLLVSRRRKRSRQLPNDANISPQVTHRRFSYLEILRATDGFIESSLIGTGSFGSVYKARFQDGMEVAVKVFHSQFEGAFESFDAECEVMRSIRHRNLVKIISSCSNDDFKALVLEYMPNGSLDKCLYSGNCILDIFQRLNIMIDVASALEYLHFSHPTPVVHCDLKPSNVLLDENMVAHLSDFGIAKLLSGEDQSMTRTQTLATIGYMAPEYGREGKVSTRGDVYSYGIMLMETFTRKKPTDEFFAVEMSLKSWVNDLLHSSLMELVDANLLTREDKYFAAKEQCVSSILNLALECTLESPKERISTRKIATRLSKVRDTLLRNVQGRRRIIIS